MYNECMDGVPGRTAGRTLYFPLHAFFLDDVTPDYQFVLYFTNFRSSDQGVARSANSCVQ